MNVSIIPIHNEPATLVTSKVFIPSIYPLPSSFKTREGPVIQTHRFVVFIALTVSARKQARDLTTRGKERVDLPKVSYWAHVSTQG